MRKPCSTTIHHSSWLRAGTRLYGYVLLLLGLFATALPSQAQTENRIYTIGNSVTDGVNFQGFKALAESRGYIHTWGRQMIPGAPLSWLWQHPNDGFTEQPFGYPTNAFPNYTWDVISLQPFDRPLEGEEGDLQISKNYIDLARGKSPDVQIYIYSRYPRKKDGLAETAANWNGLWATAYQGGWSFNEGRDYFEKLTVAVRSAYAGTTLKQPLMIPLGEVMYNLNNKMAAGEVAGFSNIWQVYSDGIHMTNVGSYIVGCTFFATMYKESPVGLPVPTQYGTINNTLRDVIQQTVWETVTGMPSWTGISVAVVNVTDVALAPATATLALNQTQQLTPTITPANATNKRVSWSSSNPAVATVSTAGVVTGVSAGSATITVTTQDGGKTATSNITVTSTPVAVESISVSPESAVVNTGNTVTLTATITPSYATNKNITWSSNQPAVASVSATGVVSGLSAGYATIFATTQDGNKEAVSQIQVTANAKPVAVISATPTSGFAPLAVNFSAAGSSDPNNGDFILGFDWDFGDGSPRANSNAPSHTYTAPGTYTVTLRVMDNHDVYSDPVTTTITVNSIDPNASVVVEYWSNVSGTSTDEVPVSTPPTSTSFLTSLEIPADVADNYGARIRGLLKPTVSGAYTFYVASDDGSKVFLSTDATPANKTLIASVTGWTSQREWTKYPTQRSAAVSLVGGQEYYFEIVYKEGNGGDNLALGWTGPGISNVTVIGSPYIKQYVADPNAPVPPSVPSNLVSSNVSQTGFTVSWNASTGTVASYNVYVGGNLAGNATTTSFNVTGLTAATSYSVTVRAVGTDGTLSAASPALTVITTGTGTPSTAQKSLDLNFTDPADANRFAFIFDTGGESVKTVENGVMKLVLNKKEWHFYQMIIDPFDFIGNPYVSFKIKVDQATPIRMWIKKGENTGIEKELYNQTIQPSADYQTINLSFTDLAPLVGDMTELGIDIGGYQTPPAVFAGTVYLDHFRLGEAAKPAAPQPSTGQKSLDLSFTNAADADRFGFILDTGGESVKTVENGVMKLVLNKKEWHFYQVYIDPFDFINNPYVSVRIKVDQATPIKMWIKKGEDDSNRKDLYEQTLQASADYQTIFIHVTDLAPLVGDMAEVGIDIGGYQVPPATFAGTVYIDHFRLGEAARGNTDPDPDPEPEPSVGDKSLNLSFTDPADADRFIFNTDTGGESVKTVENGVMKLVINKLSWHFYQLMIDPFDFINNPYVSFRIKVDQTTPIRMWIKRGVNGPEKELFNQSLQAGADFQTINLSYTDLAPLTGDATELGMDIGGYQATPGARFAGTAYLDYFRLGEAAKPGVIVDRDEIAPTAPSNLLTSAITTSSFTLNWAPATDNVGVTAYKVYANDALVATTPATTINAQITALTAATAYVVKVVAEDAAGNTTPSGTITVTTAAPAPVTLTREVWRNLTGKGIASIPVNTTPTATTQLTRLEGPVDAGDNFGARIRAFVTPAVSGYYTFYIAADDVAELWLSVGENPAQKTRIAQVTKAVKPGEWNKIAGQKATEKRLLAGEKYYIEVLHRETTGKDHVAVAWTGPGVPAITLVPASVLSPFVPGGPAPSPTTYALTVNGGLGAGSFVQGAVVNISANPAPEGQVFDAWTGNVATVANAQSPTTTVTLPAGAVSVTATYKAKPLPTVALTLNKNTRHQTIDGFGFFGARDVWWGSGDPAHFYSEAWLDRIVSDLGVSIWRNELYPHTPPTGNNKAGQDANWDKQRPMVQALKAKADQYGVDLKMILTVWSPPGEFKWQSNMAWAGDLNATRGPGPLGDYYPERAIWPDTEPVRGTLNPNKYNEYAGWLSQGLQMYKNIGINVYAISPQNEPMFPQSFNSNTYTTKWYADMINAVMPQVKAQHPTVKVFGSENMLDMEGATNNFPFFYHAGLKADPTAMNHIDMLAVHGYLDGVSASSGSQLAGYWTNHKREFADPAGKKSWMTETSGYLDTWEGTSNKPGALSLAIDMQTGLYYGDLSAWVFWQGSGLGGINEYNLMSDTQVGKKYYASKHFYRFIRPGAVRLATSSPDPEVSITAYEHAANGTHTLVLINTGTTAKAMNLAVTGSGLPTSYQMFVTSATQNCELTGTVSTAGSITLPARSVVTLQAGGMPLTGSATARVAADDVKKSQTTGLEGVTVYPNPTRGIVSVATGAAKEVRGTITTLQGVQLNVKGKQLGAGQLRFDISGQPSGIYLLRLEVDGRVKTYKLLKE